MSAPWDGILQRATTALRADRQAAEYITQYRRIPWSLIERYRVGLLADDALVAVADALKAPLPDGMRNQPWFVFPCEDVQGRVIGLELRSVGGKMYQRLLSPEARIHPVFFGTMQALPLLADHLRVALVEGALEVLSFAQITRYPVLALLTSYPNARQERWLVRWARQVTLFLNADDPARSAAKRLVRSWARRHPAVRVVDGRWWDVPGQRLGDENDLNGLLQQAGVDSLRQAIEAGLRR